MFRLARCCLGGRSRVFLLRSNSFRLYSSSNVCRVLQKSKMLNDNTKTTATGTTTDRDEFLTTLPEQLISQGNGLKPTKAENQIDTLQYYDKLISNGFTSEQSELIVTLLLEILNENFFNRYNDVFLKNMELENQSHLFHAAETELKYAIQNSRETQLNDQHLQSMKLFRDLDSLQDEINEMIINFLQKDSKVDFNNQKIENTLLHRRIELELTDCTNKIATKILGNTKSDIESLRWQTTRSGLLAILILVFFIMGGASFSKKGTAITSPAPTTLLHTTNNPEERDNDNDDDQMIIDNNDEDIIDHQKK